MTSKPNIFERLSNPNSFTGVYAERIRSGGRINAHADSGNINDLSQITRPNLRNSSTKIKMGRGIPGSHVTSGMVMDTPSTRVSELSPPQSPSRLKNKPSPQKSSPQLKRASTSSSINTTASGNSIFDRLSNENTFTGVYAERFKSDGRINAHDRDDSIIRDLSQITRPNLNLNSPSSKAFSTKTLSRGNSAQSILRSPSSPGKGKSSSRPPSAGPQRSPISRNSSNRSLLYEENLFHDDNKY
jgi:hypothetical protein